MEPGGIMAFKGFELFASRRGELVNKLTEWSHRLSKHPQRAGAIAQLLEAFEEKFDILRGLGEFDGLIIRHTIQDAHDLLIAGEPFSVSETAEILTMVATHIGRLTLSRQEGSDLYSESWDRVVEEFNDEWDNKTPDPSAAMEKRLKGLYEIWERLDFIAPECKCRQCSRGRAEGLRRKSKK
ncbi:hypothetical protein N7462_000126 [Penicillium macrosclerotiorum]|uniref:uncharacterized protein n=1 Tax=Penicillium macrosclerotiorum TaxID=303699 RepID=UPI002548C0B5|nr:uncharacterized protein N7462_000126 [Penicillium macrosclerotiorum]KAJ5698121.1 hypothetical protein N7462_000126 [Penicillium macrosclerotiorum]